METISLPRSNVVSRIFAARGLRGFSDGFISLLLPLYLLELGYAPLQVGIIASATLFGSGLLTLTIGLTASRWHYRTLLLSATVLMVATGIGFALVTDFWPLLVIAFIGTLNPSSGDVSVFLPLEHAVISSSVAATDRTSVFARYSLVGAIAASVGSLATGVPQWMAEHAGVSSKAALQSMFIAYAVVGVIIALLYRGLPRAPSAASTGASHAAVPLRKSRNRVFALAALFSLDSFGGGFVVQSMVALWLYQRFDMPLTTTGIIFFWTGLLSAFSFLVAVRIAKKIGLVNTMVYTHVPSSICLILIPLMPSLTPVIVLLMIRAALSQMDVPTRSSYVMAIVPPEERAAAASVTAVPRSLASAASPMLSGMLLSASTFGWPLLIGGVVKIVYDVLLLVFFRNVKPPEEK